MFMRGRDHSAPPKIADGLGQRSNDLPERSLMSESDDGLLQGRGKGARIERPGGGEAGIVEDLRRRR